MLTTTINNNKYKIKIHNNNNKINKIYIIMLIIKIKQILLLLPQIIKLIILKKMAMK